MWCIIFINPTKKLIKNWQELVGWVLTHHSFQSMIIFHLFAAGWLSVTLWLFSDVRYTVVTWEIDWLALLVHFIIVFLFSRLCLRKSSNCIAFFWLINWEIFVDWEQRLEICGVGGGKLSQKKSPKDIHTALKGSVTWHTVVMKYVANWCLYEPTLWGFKSLVAKFYTICVYDTFLQKMCCFSGSRF